ncbi:hypothetical protein HZ326_8651 [Fusarium oxysporum f. sp. albedinis]|nr:hypothetical protein HZ326_8651 [Fusarium oxysporum f. sp. albedinis]
MPLPHSQRLTRFIGAASSLSTALSPPSDSPNAGLDQHPAPYPYHDGILPQLPQRSRVAILQSPTPTIIEPIPSFSLPQHQQC